MRILHVIASLDPGGAERMVLQFAEDARAHGHQVAVASAGGQWAGRLPVDVQHFDIPLIARSRAALLQAALGLRAVVRRFRPDVVHSHNVGVTVAARLGMLTVTRAPLVTTLHGLSHEDYPAAARALAKTRALVVACAPAVERALEAQGFPAARRTTVVNGAALAPASPERVREVRERLQLGGQVVVGLGRLVEQKSWPTLIEAARQLDEDVDVVVAGNGPLQEELVSRATAAGGRVRFIGAVDDVAALLGTASCLVSTSAWEGLPLSLLEGLSLGLPAVVSRVDGVVDVVSDDVALLVPPGDAAAVAEGLRRVLADDALAQRLSAASLRASSAWAPETMLGAYRDLYHEQVGGRG